MKTYLIDLEYLGKPYFGVTLQKDEETIFSSLRDAFANVHQTPILKIQTAARTDRYVCAYQNFIRFSVKKEAAWNLIALNQFLGPGIILHGIKEISYSFNLIGGSKEKHYIYHFPVKYNHPKEGIIELTPLMDIISEVASFFVGEKSFHNYQYRSANSNFMRIIDTINIIPAIDFQNSRGAYPFTEGYIMEVKGKGFLRHQIRLMMGNLIDYGLGKFDRAAFESTFDPDVTLKLGHRARAEHLYLNSIILKSS